MKKSAPNQFSPPALPESRAPRRSLMACFRRAAASPLVLVSAPAGYGKSVSARLWLAERGGRQAWLGLTVYDNEPAAFYERFSEALISLQPGRRALAAIARRGAESPAGRAARLAAALRPDIKPATLVLDDFQLIDHQEIRKSLPEILRQLPPDWLTVLLTREEGAEQPDFGSLEVAVIGRKQLSFSRRDMADFFKARRRNLSPGQAEAALEATGGWPLAVNCLALDDRAGLELQGRDWPADYFEQKFRSGWDDEQREFLLKTCIVDELDGDLAERLSGGRGGAEFLEKLRADNFFISAFGGLYRYHHLFLDFLRRELAADQNIDRQALHRQAAGHYLALGQGRAALRQALRSGDRGLITQAARGLFEYAAAATDVAAFVGLFRLHLAGELKASKPESSWRVPDEILSEHPQLLALLGWYYYLSGRAGDFVATLDKLYASLPDIQNRRRDFWEGCVMLATLDPRYRIEEKVSQLQAQAGPPKATRRSVQSASLSQNLPFMHRSNRDYSPYAPDVEAGLAAFGRTFAGLLKDDFQPIEAMIRAGLYYEQNRLREALPLAESAATALAGRGALELGFSAEMLRAAILSALRREAEARENLAALRSALGQAPYLLPNLAAYESRLLMADGDQAAARRWLDNYFVNEAPEAGPLELHKIYQHFSTARAWLVLGETEKAGALLAGLKQLGRDFARPLDLAEAEVLTAVSQWHLGQKGPATESLAGAFEAVKGCGYIRVFADEGAAIEPVLKHLAAGLKKNPGRNRLDWPYLNRVMIAAKEQAARHRGLTAAWPPLMVKLSKQQRRIIGLLAQGHRNAEIAELCGLSVHTVKSHCAAAYARLGVNNAADAVIRAGELELVGDIRHDVPKR